MKRLLLPLFCALIFLTGCSFQTEKPYEFRQDSAQIMTIEIVKKIHDSVVTDTPTTVIKAFDASEHNVVIDAILAVDGGTNGLDPTTGFGVYIIKITYLNGEIEMIGNYSNGYISTDGVMHEGIYCFDTKQYYDMISNLLGEEITDYTYSK